MAPPLDQTSPVTIDKPLPDSPASLDRSDDSVAPREHQPSTISDDEFSAPVFPATPSAPAADSGPAATGSVDFKAEDAAASSANPAEPVPSSATSTSEPIQATDSKPSPADARPPSSDVPPAPAPAPDGAHRSSVSSSITTTSSASHNQSGTATLRSIAKPPPGSLEHVAPKSRTPEVPFDFNRFLEQMKLRSAIPVGGYVRTLVAASFPTIPYFTRR